MIEAKRLTAAEWKARERETGKSQIVMKALEAVVAHYGAGALHNWQVDAGLRPGKPIYRVKAKSL